MVMFKCEEGDFSVGVQYSVPVTGNKLVRAAAVKGNRLLTMWATGLLAALPVRTVPIWGGDLNTGLGLDNDGDA